MIDFDGYTIEYYKLRNLIAITLPPTEETTRNTLTPVRTRKIEVSDKELTYILSMIYLIFEDGNLKK